jgi:hypothetical protein
MQSFCTRTNGDDAAGLETGGTGQRQAEKSSLLDGENGIGLVRMTYGKDLASKGKARTYPYGTKKRQNQEGHKPE